MSRAWLFSLLVLVTVLSVDAAPVGSLVQTDAGAVQGNANTKWGGLRFLGIPYAATVSGSQRWLPSSPPTPWSSPFDATQWPVGCISSHRNKDVANVTVEDCLNLNVYVPDGVTSESKLPVMFWIHGGGFAEGANTGPFDLYDGSHLANNAKVIVVAANYRMGVFGFLAVTTGTEQLSGNFGLMDQQLALRWVQKNIAAFGGDAGNVVLWGQSAGAMSVGLHMQSPFSSGLFHKAIQESNPNSIRYHTPSEANAFAQAFCADKALNCTLADGVTCDVGCLRAAPVQAIAEAWPRAAGNTFAWLKANLAHLIDGILSFIPVIDGTLIPANVVPALLNNSIVNAVPLLIGSVHDDGATFTMGDVPKEPEWIGDIALDIVWGATAGSAIAKKYHNASADPSDYRPTFASEVNDYLFRCSSMLWPTALQALGVPAFAYRYNYFYSCSNIFPSFGLPAYCGTHVCHAAEIPFVFGNDAPAANATLTPAEWQFVDVIHGYFSCFAHTGNPNCGQPSQAWPNWDAVAQPTLILDIPTRVESSADPCAFWAQSVGYLH